MPTKFEREKDEARLLRLQKVSQQIKETDQRMSRDTSRTLLLYTGDIEPDPDQPRRLYDEDQAALSELAASIRQVGVLSPIQVRPHPDAPDRYRIIVGERRWRACQMAGVNRIEAVVREDWDAFQIRAAQYEENEKRQDVSDMARARSLAAMRDAGSGKRRSWEDIAKRVGLQRNQVMRLVGLQQLPSSVQEMIDRRLLPGTHGFELVRLRGRVPDDEIQTLAESSCASIPGAKAGRPVKELARLVTDRLQAAFEASSAAADDETPPEVRSSTLEATWPEAIMFPEPNELPVADKIVKSSIEDLNTQNNVAANPPRPTTNSVEPDTADAPRAFILELGRAWRDGNLRPTEQRILQDLFATHPLSRIK